MRVSACWTRTNSSHLLQPVARPNTAVYPYLSNLLAVLCCIAQHAPPYAVALLHHGLDLELVLWTPVIIQGQHVHNFPAVAAAAARCIGLEQASNLHRQQQLEAADRWQLYD